jgi:hypothetical protein
MKVLIGNANVGRLERAAKTAANKRHFCIAALLPEG